MANRTRTNRNEFHLDDKEQYILDEKFKLSGMNQIAKRINSTNHVYQEDMDEVKELMKQV